MKVIDARGLSCPEPVVLCSNAIETDSQFQMLVDTETQVENITRFAELKGYRVHAQKREGDIELTIKK